MTWWWLIPAAGLYLMVAGFVGEMNEEDGGDSGWGLIWPLLLVWLLGLVLWETGGTVYEIPQRKRERAAAAARVMVLQAEAAAKRTEEERKRTEELERQVGIEPLPVIPPSGDEEEPPKPAPPTFTHLAARPFLEEMERLVAELNAAAQINAPLVGKPHDPVYDLAHIECVICRRKHV